MSKLSFIQLNMRKAFVAAMELGRRVAKLETEVVCLITEPSRYKNKVCSLPRGFKSIAAPGARAAIYWRGNFDVLKIEQLCNMDCAVGIIKIGRNNLLLVSGYLDIKLSVVPDWLVNIVKYSNKKKYPILLRLDTNAHSTLYGPVSNPRGEEAPTCQANWRKKRKKRRRGAWVVRRFWLLAANLNCASFNLLPDCDKNKIKIKLLAGQFEVNK